MREYIDLPAATTAAVPGPRGDFELREEPVPSPGDGGILYRLLGAGVSRADIGASGVASMVLVGETAAVGSRVRGWGPGDRLVIRVPADPGDARWPRPAGHFRVPGSLIRSRLAFKLPREITVDEALLLPEAARAVRVLRETRLGEGETFVVAGLALLGQITVALAHHRRRARVVAADASPTLRRRAEYNGAERLVRLPDESLIEAVLGRPRQPGAAAALADGVAPAVLQQVLASLAPGASLILAGVREPVWPLDARTVLQRELRVQGLASGEPRDTKDAAKAFQQGTLDADTLISKRLSWNELPDEDLGLPLWEHALSVAVTP